MAWCMSSSCARGYASTGDPCTAEDVKFSFERYKGTGAKELQDDEIGSWMIPGDEKQYVAAYLASLAAVATPEEFTTVAVPLIERDRDQSGATRAYASALRVANKAQEAALKAAIKRRKIRTRRRS